jgi:hypothetical protein
MTWATKRQLAYLSGVILFFGTIGFFTIRHYVVVPPTCFDKKKNGGESGVDCGGSCLQYCPNELSDPKIRWSRSFVVTPGIVHAVAYVEHSYPASSAKNVRYMFKLYDEKNSLIVEKEGQTYLGPMGKIAIVETLIPVGNNTVATTRFSFLPTVPWEKSNPLFAQVVIKTDRTLLENYGAEIDPNIVSKKVQQNTRLTATLENTSRYSFSNMDVAALLYDDKDNTIAVSKTVLPLLSGQSKQTVYFTWPFVIKPESVRTIEIIPRFNTFDAKEI